MPLDATIITDGRRPLKSLADLANEGMDRQIKLQEATLKAQEIQARTDALRQRDQPKPPTAQDALAELNLRLKKAEVATNAFEKATPENWGTTRGMLLSVLGQDVAADLPDAYPGPEWVQQHVQAGRAAQGVIKQQALQKIDTTDANGNPVQKFIVPSEGAEYPMVSKAQAGEAKPGTFEDYVSRMATEKGKPVGALTTAEIEAARKRYNQADDRPRVTVTTAGDTDTEAIADAIMRGEQPPTLQGLYGRGAAVRAALAKKGYNLASAQTDWTATQKHLATLNGSQQTRMRQAVDNAYHSLDVIETLAKQWDAGRFPLLNRAQLEAAKQGALGKNAQQIATQLEAQISDVTSELGNVYMGGNSPTDHALSLAAKNLSASWSKDQLVSALKLARTNLEIRSNSMKNVGVAGIDNSQYLPGGNAPAAPKPTHRYNPATGKVEAIQ